MKITKIIFFTMLAINVYSCISSKEYTALENSNKEAEIELNKQAEELSILYNEKKSLESEVKNFEKAISRQMVAPSVSYGRNLLENKDLLDVNNFQEIDLSKTSTDTLFNCLSTKPLILSELNSGSTKFVYTIDAKTSSNANLLGLFNGTLKRNERIAIVDYVEYKDMSCPNSQSLRVAAGVRLTLNIITKSNNFKINIPSKVAAASEFGVAEVTYRIETIGFVNSTTRGILSGLGGAFNVEDYVKVLDAVNKIQLAMNDVVNVDPKVIPMSY